MKIVNGDKVPSTIPEVAQHVLLDTHQVNKTKKRNQKYKKVETESSGEDNDFTPIKNCEVLEVIHSPSHPMKMRSKPKKRTLNFCEEYLGNLDDYDFTDYMLNDNNPTVVKRNNRRKKTISDKKIEERHCEDSVTATSPQSIAATSKCSVKIQCNSDYKTNQIEINDASQYFKTSTISEFDSFQQSNNKRKQNNSYKKSFKRRKFDSKKAGSRTAHYDNDPSNGNIIHRNTVNSTVDSNTECNKPVILDALQKQLNNGFKSIAVDQHCLEKKVSFSTDEYDANSPDSGFVSESSSAASPSCENISEFFNHDKEKSEWGDKKPSSPSSSSDSGIITSCDNEAALNLCKKAVQAAEKLKRDAEKKAEDEILRIKYQCKWLSCPNPFEARSSGDLHNHLIESHVRHIKSKFCCKWRECKYFEKSVRKESWLQWHVLDHSGEKPFKCIINGCDASFVSSHGLSRHVNSHYTEVTLPKAKVGGEASGAKLIIRRRKIQNERKALANLHDCMDNHTLQHMKQSLLAHEQETQMQQNIFGERMQLQPEIMGRKMNDGKSYVFIEWHPRNILPNEWVEESQINQVTAVNQTRVFASKLKNLQSLFRCPGQRPRDRRRK